MSRRDDRSDDLDLDGFRGLMADKPRDEEWDLIGGRVAETTTGARRDHRFIVQDIDFALSRHRRDGGSPSRLFTGSVRLKEDAFDAVLVPDVVVRCGPTAPGATSSRSCRRSASVGTGSRRGGLIRSCRRSCAACSATSP
ncbi:Uma2 family endonuclease [Lichenibacterium minor]|uniref:Uma2 family endonuclease n=1 Tax=Lichenibacterium minor TaxID=2316528 RepID=A0A4Q2UCT5_9HYPH|nr:Uma2 family endonuclease [Lichenibacterium minor]RYC33081.1 Uma2 family endonuclease [Lichenibacterium minor]